MRNALANTIAEERSPLPCALQCPVPRVAPDSPRDAAASGVEVDARSVAPLVRPSETGGPPGPAHPTFRPRRELTAPTSLARPRGVRPRRSRPTARIASTSTRSRGRKAGARGRRVVGDKQTMSQDQGHARPPPGLGGRRAAPGLPMASETDMPTATTTACGGRGASWSRVGGRGTGRPRRVRANRLVPRAVEGMAQLELADGASAWAWRSSYRRPRGLFEPPTGSWPATTRSRLTGRVGSSRMRSWRRMLRPPTAGLHTAGSGAGRPRRCVGLGRRPDLHRQRGRALRLRPPGGQGPPGRLGARGQRGRPAGVLIQTFAARLLPAAPVQITASDVRSRAPRSAAMRANQL